MRLLEYGMEHEDSRNPLQRLAAKLCIWLVKKEAARLERHAEKSDITVESPACSAQEMFIRAQFRKELSD